MAKLHLPFNTRRAICLAHRKLCVYCGEPIAFTDLDIEHIIPETRAQNAEEWAATKAEYGLPDTFDINSLANLVPAHHNPCNLNKGSRLFSPARARYFLEIAASKEPTVLQYARAIVLEEGKEKVLGSIKSAIERGEVTLPEIVVGVADNDTFPLSAELEFADGVSKKTLIRSEIDSLLDRPVLVGRSR
jgi:5-methylcytosine-specific restriction endonuclease McrA